MGVKNKLPQEKELQYLWEAALKGWDKETGDLIVTFQEFDDFLLLCGFTSYQGRDTRRRLLKLKGYIHYRDGPANRGNPKKVTIYSTPKRLNKAGSLAKGVSSAIID